jgi:hypothetical protein
MEPVAMPTHKHQVIPRRTSPAVTDSRRSHVDSGRVATATLAAALNVARHHADVQAARRAQVLHAEIGVERVPFPLLGAPVEFR